MLENIESRNNGLANNTIPLFRTTSDNIRAQKTFEAACYNKLTSTCSLQDFKAKISEILKHIGFPTFYFAGLFSPPRFLISTLPEALVQSYQKGEFIRSDYAIQYGLSAPVAATIFRSTIESYMAGAPVETHDMARNRELSNLYKCNGYYDCYLIPLCSGSTRYLLSITAHTMDMESFYKNITAHEQELTLLANLILHLGLLKFKEYFQYAEQPKEINIHSRPVKLLSSLAKNDLSLEHSAGELCISLHTANHHIATIKKSLGAKTTAGAVYMAIKRGLID